MAQKYLALALLVPLVACGGSGDGSNPINCGTLGTDNCTDTDTTTDTGGTTEDGEPISGDRGLPPGTESPAADNSLFRYEPLGDGETAGSGYARAISYDAENDEFFVDNLGFDGDNVYTRDNLVGSLGPYAVYENSESFDDPVTGAPIAQFAHKALYGVSTNTDADGNPTTQFAIVRTGSYIEYGFGGYVYQRNGGVTLPDTGQAQYTGAYAALRDFNNLGGLEYATGDMTMAIDFEDFDAGDAVRGEVYNRRVFDDEGNDITIDVVTALEDKYGLDYTGLPVIRFVISPDALDTNGELTGSVRSFVQTNSGSAEVYEDGNYYAVLSGDNAEEVVGIIAVTAEDPRAEGVTVRETGGFILYRP
ncbi:hypothetical protein Ga0609869_000588 [Rhodovulum iodosum]|uniref:Transferrin-binding protein B C-lobe/N-lobe beta barrel domain-containing protein n=1 Tax=Rhodovulum iodosum TaxID=68291 RepID=A0ABV3XPI2_9RHOB|nr:hypothetical protein [Rhodovulum robiginosum]RSK31472.1 hypothetical protein EJA01_15150 [Rhodovulum robiginosum]